jgi:ribose-phosphate pyrophosphokinase
VHEEVVLLSTPLSAPFAERIFQIMSDYSVPIKALAVIRDEFPNHERYYRIEVEQSFSLLGKTAVYVAAVTSDEEILELYRVGGALAQAGLRRRIFVIPFLGYSSMDRAEHPGEIVTAKANSQMMGVLGAGDDGTVFLFLDLHYPCLLHYFEGPCVRLELHCRAILLEAIRRRHRDTRNLVVGSTNLRRANWVNAYATALGVPLVMIRDKPREVAFGGPAVAFRSDAAGVVGDVRGRYVLIYDDIVRSGRTIIDAAAKYCEAGAVGVDVCATHLACYEEQQLADIASSRIGVVIATNTHPMTQKPIVRSSKFIIVDVSDAFTQALLALVPSAPTVHGMSF